MHACIQVRKIRVRPREARLSSKLFLGQSRTCSVFFECGRDRTISETSSFSVLQLQCLHCVSFCTYRLRRVNHVPSLSSPLNPSRSLAGNLPGQKKPALTDAKNVEEQLDFPVPFVQRIEFSRPLNSPFIPCITLL